MFWARSTATSYAVYIKRVAGADSKPEYATWESRALPDMREFKRIRKRKAQQKPTMVEIEEGVVHVELSPQLQEWLSRMARVGVLSEADLIREAIAEAISRRTRQKPN
jgi:hypothetical protein